MSDEPIRQGGGFWSCHAVDGTPSPSPGANYIVIPHIQYDFSGELRSPRPEDTILLNGGVIDIYAATVPGGDQFLAQGVPYTFTYLWFHKTGIAIFQALSNTFDETITADAWDVGAGTFLNAAGTGANVISSNGASVPPIQAADSRHMRVHFEFLQIQQQGGGDFGLRMEECHVDSCTITIAEVSTQVRVAFRRFGRVDPITAFTTGTNLTPAVT